MRVRQWLTGVAGVALVAGVLGVGQLTASAADPVTTAAGTVTCQSAAGGSGPTLHMAASGFCNIPHGLAAAPAEVTVTLNAPLGSVTVAGWDKSGQPGSWFSILAKNTNGTPYTGTLRLSWIASTVVGSLPTQGAQGIPGVQGVPGVAGPAGEDGADGAGIHLFSNTAAYVAGDMVLSNLCLFTANGAVAAGGGAPDDGADWTLRGCLNAS